MPVSKSSNVPFSASDTFDPKQSNPLNILAEGSTIPSCSFVIFAIAAVTGLPLAAYSANVFVSIPFNPSLI